MYTIGLNTSFSIYTNYYVIDPILLTTSANIRAMTKVFYHMLILASKLNYLVQFLVTTSAKIGAMT